MTSIRAPYLSVASMTYRRMTGPASSEQRREPLAPPTEEVLDRLTFFAGEALGVTAVCVAVVDTDGRLLTSSYGLPVPTALLVSHAFRRHIAAVGHRLVVGDTRRNPLFSDNPAVRDGTVRACLGVPLGTADGRAVGTLLVLDQHPRRWTTPQLDLVATLSRLIPSEMEFGMAVRRAARASRNAPGLPVEAAAPTRFGAP